MEKINLQNYRITQKSKITSERALILKEFLDRLNAERGQYKPIKPQHLGFMMRFMTTSQMYQFLGQCKDSKHFSKYFWWRFKK